MQYQRGGLLDKCWDAGLDVRLREVTLAVQPGSSAFSTTYALMADTAELGDPA